MDTDGQQINFELIECVDIEVEVVLVGSTTSTRNLKAMSRFQQSSAEHSVCS